MRILEIVSYYPPHIGGMEKFVKELFKIFKNDKIKIQVVTSSIGQNKNNIEKNVYIIPAKEIFKIPISFKLIPFLLNKKFDIFYLNFGGLYFPDIGFIIAKLKRIPIISHVHIDIHSYSILGKLFFYFYNNFWLKFILKNSDITIFPTRSFQTYFLSKYKLNIPNIVIPYGFFMNKFKNFKKANLNGPPIIIFVGRLQKQKNVILFVKAIYYLSQKIENFKVYIIGEGYLRDYLISYVKKLKINKYIDFLGRLLEDELIDIYKKSDILVLPSRLESAGIVILEALASSVIVVGSDVPGINSIIKNNINGYLIKNITPKNLSTLLYKIILNRENWDFIINNGIKTVKNYDWKIVKNCYKNLFELIKNKKNRIN
ncbi:MAG: glycosyltransferase family 4 protein [Candidatus Helarchaeota archaeon]